MLRKSNNRRYQLDPLCACNNYDILSISPGFQFPGES